MFYSLTHYGEVEPQRSSLRGAEIDSTTVNAVVALADVEYFEPGLLRPGTRVEHDSVVPENIRVHPMRSDILRAGNVDATPGVCKKKTQLFSNKSQFLSCLFVARPLLSTLADFHETLLELTYAVNGCFDVLPVPHD